MKRVYTAANAFDARIVCDHLNHEGIAATIHGLLLTGALGELPLDTAPTVWIEDPDLYERARDLIARFERPADAGDAWRCACGEVNEASFELCWSCGRPPRTGPANG